MLKKILKFIVATILILVLCLASLWGLEWYKQHKLGYEKTIAETEQYTGLTLGTEEIEEIKETVIEEKEDTAELLSDTLTNLINEKEVSSAAFDKISSVAELGNSDAQYLLGEFYFQGLGTDVDLSLAGDYLKKSCEAGNEKGMLLYAKMLFLGDGVAQNYDESASYLHTVAGNDGEAEYILAIMANIGLGMPRDGALAKEYIEKASSLGYTQADGYKSKILDGNSQLDGIDDFKLKAKKINTIEYGGDNKKLQDMLEEYAKILQDSCLYEKFESEIKEMYSVDIQGLNFLTYFGNDGFLFHQNKNDGTSVHDYIGDNHFSEKELTEIADNLKQQKEWIESNGSKFVLLLIPNKENMYPESVPGYIKRIDEVSREDQLVEYLKKNTDIDIVYTKDSLKKYKDTLPLYYKTDTHANMVGTLVMVSDLFKKCYDMDINIDLDKFAIHMEDYLGDLGNMAGSTKRYASDKVYFYPDSSVLDEDKIDSSMILVGDSFSEFMNIEVGYYLNSGVDHRMITEYNYDYHDATQAGLKSGKPEYVVWECVERYLDRLK